jgi:hypothetical protein
MTMDKPQLAEIIDTRDEQPPIWVAYPGSSTFKVLIRPIGGKQQEFMQAATEPQWDLAVMKKRQVLNAEKYLELFGGYVVVDWQGLTIADIRRLVLVKDWKKIKGFKGEIAFDGAARKLLITWAPGFSAWLNKVTFDIERFNQEREAEAEKK